MHKLAKWQWVLDNFATRTQVNDIHVLTEQHTADMNEILRLAQEAHAAAYALPDEAVAALLANPMTLTRTALMDAVGTVTTERLEQTNTRIDDAFDQLLAASGQISDAFSQIDLLPDQAYIDAARQQAIDTAMIEAQYQDVQNREALEEQILAETAAAKQAAIDAAAADATAKTEAAEAAAALEAARLAQEKADAAQAAAEQAAREYADAIEAGISPEDLQALKDYADSSAEAARIAAEQAAAADATSKAEQAEANAAQQAADDATAKADAARDAAIAAAATDAQEKADAAELAAKNAAAADATAKAEAAEAAAARTAALDATSKADAARIAAEEAAATHAQLVADGAKQDAIDAASADATTKADLARQAAEDAAAADATQKAEAAEAAAAATAAVDAQAKADAAQQAAIQAAAIDAQNKADQALTDAKADATAKANAAEQAAKTAAAADATAKAEAAEAAAAATAAADATEKANAAKAAAESAAKTYADAVSSGASGDALAAAKTYAEQQAAAAENAAKVAAAADATSKAEAAQAEAARLAALDATEKADAARAAAEAASAAAESRALSRGTDLVTNGTGYLKSNYNFSSMTYLATDAPPGMTGSFMGEPGVYSQPRTDELIPVDPSKKYRLSVWAKTVTPRTSSDGRMAMFYVPYDADGREMLSRFFRYQPGTTTTLTEALNPGDTTVTVASTAGWHNGSSSHLRSIIWWDYVDDNGKAYPPGTYSRNITGNNIYPEGGINGNVITLSSPYSGEAKPAGHPLSNNSNSSAYLYVTSTATQPPDDRWAQYSNVIEGVTDNDGNAIGGSWGYTFPYGTASIKIGFLVNYQPGPSTHNIAISGISLSDASAAQDTANQALSDAETKSAAARQAAIAAAAADATAKAEQAEADAVAAAAADATAKANQAKADAEAAAAVHAALVAGNAEQSAIDAAAITAQQKADAAQTAAEQAAALDATAKAEQAEANAAATAAADATAKADAARDAAIAAAATDATEKADQALTDAKAFAVDRTDGISKTVASTALPGTTVLPQYSTWYRLNASGDIVSVFQQASAPSGNDWQARALKSEAIDNLDVGKITGLSGEIDDLVANLFAAKLANIIEANIGNLTVVGDTHLTDLVAQVIAGDVGEFVKVIADNIEAGNINVQMSITSDGKIICGDPEGARVEISHDGIRIWVVGPNGEAYVTVSMINGHISFGVVDQDGTRLGGIDSEGGLLARTAAIQSDPKIMGRPLIGKRYGGGQQEGWMDGISVLVGSVASRTTTAWRSASTEAIYLRYTKRLLPNRTYRVVGLLTGQLNANNGVLRGNIRYTTGSTTVTTSSTELWGPSTTAPVYNATVNLDARVEGFLTVPAPTTVNFALTYRGINGSGSRAQMGRMYIEDLGPRGFEYGEGDNAEPKTLYTTTWQATHSTSYNKSGARLTAKDGMLDQWYWGGTPTDYQPAAMTFSGGAIIADDPNELGKTMYQALNGAIIEANSLYLRNKIWFGGAESGIYVLGTLGSASLPSSQLIDGQLRPPDIAPGEASVIDLPTTWFINGANRGITIGDKDGVTPLGGQSGVVGLSSGSFHGPNDDDPPKLTVVYSK